MPKEAARIDAIDRRILRLLQADAKISNAELSRRVGLSPSPCLARVRALERAGIISRHVTLHPGDLIFTGTPGETSQIKTGDVVEVDLEGVGVLRNPVVAETP